MTPTLYITRLDNPAEGFGPEYRIVPEGTPGAEAWIPRDAVRVKPLEWEGSAADFYLHVTTDAGLYEISVEYGDEWFCDYTDHRTGRPVRLSGCQDRPVAPQAAANKHNEARIMSALAALPAPPGAQEEGE